jgi:hypothetical protein
MFAAALALLSACAPASTAPIAEQWRNVDVQVSQVEIGWPREQLADANGVLELGAPVFGSLLFRGGLALRADVSTGFGGWSDLEVMEDGRLIAVSDDGKWLSARLMLDESGALVGLSETRIAAMRDESGARFESKEAGDAEGLAQLPDGRFAVSFEQSQTIRIYDFNRDGPFGAARPGPVLAEVGPLPSNAGIEALAAGADGALIVGAEDRDLVWRATLHGAAPAQVVAHYRRAPGFSLTSLDRLPDGNYVALERFYAPVIGGQVRIARLDAARLEEGEVDTEQWALLSAPLVLDNFEGVSAVRSPSGGVRLYILSDDNFSPRQRTLLYAFDVVDGGASSTPRER